MKYLLLVLGLLVSTASADEVVWVEAEQFADTGRWSNDSQYVDLMGSPYLLATGVGKPVDDAVTRVQIPAAGEYRLWVRCKDWLPSHSPGRFQVVVGGRVSKVVFGKAKTDAWQWVDGGPFDLKAGATEIRLHDTTGWWGRCDAVVLAPPSFRPSNDTEALAAQRYKFGGVSAEVERPADFDVVVVGGGPAGLGASIAAARHGCRVALVQDRPVLGGNSSSEIQVPPMGYIGNPPDKVNITGLAEELFPTQGWHNFADSKKIERIVRAEKNISLMLNTRATGVEMAVDHRIAAVLAMNVHTGRRMALSAPLFIDCTGHGWIGYYAGADYRMGQEARGEFDESLAPVEAGKRTMGNSLYNAGFETHEKPVPFQCPDWAYQWTKSEDFEPLGSHRRLRTIQRPDNFDVPSRGKGRNPGNDLNGAIVYAWWVEYGGMLSTIDDAEQIRDELFRISIGLWNYAKNHNPGTVGRNVNRELVWLNYVPGVRESRRLMGDYIMSQQDFDRRIEHPDIVAFTDWGPDVHHPEGFWVEGNDCIHVYQGRRTGIPYRTLYSRNIGNLLIAGRCHSATHVALGGTRVMRPMSMTGQAAGTAAALALRHKTDPRGVYESHIRPLQQA
ncbi:MAG: FAD-dependent oxidoreductase, partial [Thermoguttaceae bacterium]